MELNDPRLTTITARLRRFSPREAPEVHLSGYSTGNVYLYASAGPFSWSVSAESLELAIERLTLAIPELQPL